MRVRGVCFPECKVHESIAKLSPTNVVVEQTTGFFSTVPPECSLYIITLSSYSLHIGSSRGCINLHCVPRFVVSGGGACGMLFVSVFVALARQSICAHLALWDDFMHHLYTFSFIR